MRGIIAALTAGALATSGCSESKDAYTHVHSPPVQLFGTYKSNISPSTVLASLSAQRKQFSVVEHVTLPPEDPRPHYDFYEIEVADQEYCGTRGALRFSFFNHRLLSTTFYPVDARACLALLPQASLRNGNGEATEGELVISAHIDYREKQYVAWRDLRLVRELDRWVSNYS